MSTQEIDIAVAAVEVTQYVGHDGQMFSSRAEAERSVIRAKLEEARERKRAYSRRYHRASDAARSELIRALAEAGLVTEDDCYSIGTKELRLIYARHGSEDMVLRRPPTTHAELTRALVDAGLRTADECYDLSASDMQMVWSGLKAGAPK